MIENFDFSAFSGSEHEPFFWPAGDTAALLVHGFPGTPAEVRPLAKSLHEDELTTQGILLPGFGPELTSLPDHSAADWVGAVKHALTTLQAKHRPVILLGYSLGAALSLNTAAQIKPDALVLLAPFWQLGGCWSRPLVWLMRPFVSQFKPFRLLKPDFKDPGFRQGVNDFMPSLDLDDPEAQQAVLDFAIPTKIIAEIQRAGTGAYRAATSLHDIPILVIQGQQDTIVPPKRTQQLVARLPGSAQYHEVSGGHDLLDTEQPAWSDVVGLIGRFVASQIP